MFSESILFEEYSLKYKVPSIGLRIYVKEVNRMKKLVKPCMKKVARLYGESHGGNCNCAGA